MSQRMGTAALCSVSRHSDQGWEGGWACRDFQAGLPHCSLLPGFLLPVCSEVREGTHYDVKLRQNGTNPFKGVSPHSRAEATTSLSSEALLPLSDSSLE